MNSIKIAFVTDNNYFDYMFVAIESLITNNKDKNKINFYIIDMGIAQSNINKIQKRYFKFENITFEFIKIDQKKLEKYNIKTHVSSAAYAKVYISNLINVDKVIYLDCDLVVIEDILKLWNMFDNTTSIKAVWNPFYNYDNEYLGVDHKSKTFNSGVMLLNLDLIRKKDTTTKLVNFLNDNHNKTKLHDQAAFNAIFKDEWQEIDLHWNCQVSMLQNSYSKLNISKNTYYRLYRNASIVHFTSNSKPWLYRNSHPYKKTYLKYHKRIFGNINYTDVNIKSTLQKIKEKITYEYYFISNKIKRKK